MNIMVFNVPAETVGALSILNDFYEEISRSQDYSINWIFVLSKPMLEETQNIRVLRFPWVKKSWFHRLYFDHMIAPKLIKKFHVDRVLSFQNVVVPHASVEQLLYMHNSIPFSTHKFRLGENWRLWVYQNVIGRLIKTSIKKADKVIVQSEWIKRACVEQVSIVSDKIQVIPPKINTSVANFFTPKREFLSTFFYPASEYEYKNHRLVVKACAQMVAQGTNGFEILFTLNGDETAHIKRLFEEVQEKRLPIKFIGHIPRDRVFDLYSRSILLFPSYLETFGLPLLEARMHRTIILASDCLFSHEILCGYENAHFFDPFDENKLCRLMSLLIFGEIRYKAGTELMFEFDQTGSIFDLVMSKSF